MRLVPLLSWLLLLSGCAHGPGSGGAPLEEALDRLGVPGLAAAVWRDGRLIEGAAGVRERGSGDPVRPGDPFQIGSVTKTFTAALAGRLVERGWIEWNDTVGERLGFLPALRDEYRDVTLADLLAHRGGIVINPPAEEGARLAAARSLVERRRAAAAVALSLAPTAEPRRDFRYSNFSYVVAAAMIEQATGRSWEELIRLELLAPLGLGSAGFGPPRGEGPRGHDRFGAPVQPDGPAAGNPPFSRPAGGLHMAMRDLAMFGADQVRGAHREGGTLLRAESYSFLHAPVPGGEATGWIRAADGSLWHDGSDGRWFALLRVIPAERLVVAIAANSAGQDPARTRSGLWELSESLRRLSPVR